MPDQLLPWLTGKIEKDDLKHALWNVWIGSYDRAKGRQSLLDSVSLFARYIPADTIISADAIYPHRCNISLQMRYISASAGYLASAAHRQAAAVLIREAYVSLRSARNVCRWHSAICRGTGSGQRMLCTAQGAACLYDLYKKSENY